MGEKAPRWGRPAITFDSNEFENEGHGAVASQESVSEQGSGPFEDLSRLLTEDLETFTVSDWYTLEPHQQVPIIKSMSPWVDWLAVTHKFGYSVIPPCWFAHSDLIHELYALWAIYQIGYASTDAGSGPLTFLERLHSAQMRMRLIVNATGCTRDTHAVSPIESVVTDHECELWQTTMTALSTPMEVPAQ